MYEYRQIVFLFDKNTLKYSMYYEKIGQKMLFENFPPLFIGTKGKSV